MLRFWLVLSVVCGWVACQPVGPNLPWLALYKGGYVSGAMNPQSLTTAATLCATIRAVQLTTPAAQPLVYIGSYANEEGFGFGLDEDFNIAIWQGRAGVTSSPVKIDPDVTNFICVAFVFNTGSTQVRVLAYQPSFQSELLTIEAPAVAPTARITIGSWPENTYTGFINNVQVYREAFTATQPFKFSYDHKVNSDYNLLVGYPFREGAGSTVATFDGSGDALNVVGDHAWHKRYLNSLALSGTNSAIVLPVPSVIAGPDLTIAMWMKIGTILETDKKDVFVLNGVNAFYDPVANEFGVTSNGDTVSFNNYPVPKDTWIFVAFQIEGNAGYVRLFVNNEEEQAFSGSVNSSATTVTIGGGNYGSLRASVTSIQIWNSINVGDWGMGFTRIALLNGDEKLGAHYNLADTKGTTIYNWFHPPAQGELQGDITWEPLLENALNLSPSDVVAFSAAPLFSVTTYAQFTFAMNLHWRAPTLTETSVIVNVGEFSDTGFGLRIESSGILSVSVGFATGMNPQLYPIPDAQIPPNKTVPVIVTLDFAADSMTATIDGVAYPSQGLALDYADVDARVHFGRPTGGSWAGYTGFDGFISDFQMWRSLRSSQFFVGDLQKNALVSTLNPYMYAPLTDNNGGVLEIMGGALATPLTGLRFGTFPDRVSQFNFDFPVVSPDGTIVPQAAPGTVSGPVTPSDTVVTPNVPIEVVVPAVVVPVVVVAVGLIVLIVLLKRRKNKKEPKEPKKAVTIENPVNDVEAARAAFSENRSTSYSNIPMQRVVASNNETSKNVDKLLNLAMRDRLNIPHEKIKFIEEIGSGSFGKVYKGDWQHCEVAVKVANVISNMDSFIQEAELMMAIRPHPNVVQLLGVSVDGGSPEMVLEFCPSGSLDTLLQSQVPLNDEQKIKLSLGIARGMLHLHLNNIIHRDLAARNILLSKDGQPKISDFGMSRVLGSDVAHTGQTRSYVGPIKWMAPEALREAIYGRKTDVWSYGITVWEIVTRKEPFDGVDLIQSALLIRDQGVTPEIPSNCPPVLTELMRMCWHQDPEQRPEFEDVCKFLQKEVK